jgi:hypothetical protein
MSSTTVSGAHRYTATLCTGAETCVQAMHLSTQDQQTVRDCVSRYAMPSTFSVGGYFHWLVFRITNVFKAINGQSEWQMVQKIIETQALAIAEKAFHEGFEGKDLNSTPRYHLRQMVQSRSSALAEYAAYNLMEACLYAQNHPDKPANQLALDNGLDKLSDQVKDMIDKGAEGLSKARDVYRKSKGFFQRA